MKQAALLLGGQFATDQTGFLHKRAHSQAPLSINSGTDTEWKINSKQAISRAIITQLSDRLLNLDDEDEWTSAETSGSRTRTKGCFLLTHVG